MSDSPESNQPKSKHIESVLQESRRFTPHENFQAQAKLSTLQDYQRLYRQSLDAPDTFWRTWRTNSTGSSRGTQLWSGKNPS